MPQSTPPRAVLTISIPYHLRQRIADDAARYGAPLSSVLAAVLAKHYGTTVDGIKPAAKKAAKAQVSP